MLSSSLPLGANRANCFQDAKGFAPEQLLVGGDSEKKPLDEWLDEGRVTRSVLLSGLALNCDIELLRIFICCGR